MTDVLILSHERAERALTANSSTRSTANPWSRFATSRGASTATKPVSRDLAALAEHGVVDSDADGR